LRAKTIHDYLAGVEPKKRAALEGLRKTIRSILPAAEECISYSMPAFRLRRKIVAGFAATKSGCSYFPFSGTTIGAMAKELTSYSQTKSSLHSIQRKAFPSVSSASSFDPERGARMTDPVPL
jgi:uncharacterized protein YdhG (YjbR/CyaY superfamily)